VRPVFALPEPHDRLMVAGIAGQKETAQPLDRGNAASIQKLS
jgi:hypothetical protein